MLGGNHSLWITEPQLTVFVLHCTPPAMAMGVQPVPMGMFRPLSTTLMSGPSRLFVAESSLLEFCTFWQHCAEPVVDPVAETAPTRARAVMNVFENMVAKVVVRVVRVVEGECVGCGSSSLRKESTSALTSYTRPARACVMKEHEQESWVMTSASASGANEAEASPFTGLGSSRSLTCPVGRRRAGRWP
jgi:hypothetical protein